MRRHQGAIAAAALALSACGNLQHNDVLVFATETKVAFDVSASAVDGGAPEVTLGYKRKEGVWMPLVVNGRSSTLLSDQVTCDAQGRCYTMASAIRKPFEDCVRLSAGKPEACIAALRDEVKYVGQAGDRTDTYSTFASFGAEFAGGGTGAKAGLAQFFATGIAAQRLAERDQIYRALKVEDPDEAAVDDARQVTQAALRTLGEGQGSVLAGPQVTAVTQIASCWNANRAAFRARAKTDLGAGADAGVIAVIDADDEANFRTMLSLYPDERAKLVGTASAVCPEESR